MQCHVSYFLCFYVGCFYLSVDHKEQVLYDWFIDLGKILIRFNYINCQLNI
jgi:hypothetical protein